MSVYNPNIPQASDELSDSQGDILQNFQRANSSFGIDHYPFGDLTANNGKHNQITTPAFVASPPTALPPVTIAAEPKIYAFQDSANLGVINYSRGPLNVTPTPLTHLQSPVGLPSAPLVLASGLTTPVLNFTGLSIAICMLYMANVEAAAPMIVPTVNKALIGWNGSNLLIDDQTGNSLSAEISGTTLLVKNNTAFAMSKVYWTLDFLRLS